MIVKKTTFQVLNWYLFFIALKLTFQSNNTDHNSNTGLVYNDTLLILFNYFSIQYKMYQQLNYNEQQYIIESDLRGLNKL